MGFIWFGNFDDAIYWYNGNYFVNFRNIVNDSTSLNNNSISGIIEDSKGNCWTGTRNRGLNSVDLQHNKFYHFKHNSSEIKPISNNQVRIIVEEKDGYLWIGNDNGRDSFIHNKNPLSKISL